MPALEDGIQNQQEADIICNTSKWWIPVSCCTGPLSLLQAGRDSAPVNAAHWQLHGRWKEPMLQLATSEDMSIQPAPGSFKESSVDTAPVPLLADRSVSRDAEWAELMVPIWPRAMAEREWGEVPDESPIPSPPPRGVHKTLRATTVGSGDAQATTFAQRRHRLVIPDRTDSLHGLTMLKRSVGNANAAALSESGAPSNVEIWLAEASLTDADIKDDIQEGSCGFTVAIPKDAPQTGPPSYSMCHHYTWDGKHCVTAGIKSEHANRCAGQLCIVGGIADQHLCKNVGVQPCAKISDGSHVEAVCGPPAWTVVCRVDNCPFLAEGLRCPYGGAFKCAAKPALRNSCPRQLGQKECVLHL